jgi:hypothetical protein
MPPHRLAGILGAFMGSDPLAVNGKEAALSIFFSDPLR